MTSQPRRPAGSRRAGVSEGGRYTTKPVPEVADTELGFGNDPADWSERKVKLWGLTTTFTRTVDDDGTVTVAASCDTPELVLLAHKGDIGYWCGNAWSKDHKTRRVWSAAIAVEMLNEGFVGVGDDTGDGIRAVMNAAASPKPARSVDPHTLTSIVAHIRGARLLQSMAPQTGWSTELGGYDLPTGIQRLLSHCFETTEQVYQRLRQPPWGDDVAWGPQHVAGHAITSGYTDMFVGTHGDLLWRALTETDLYGRSALNQKLRERFALSSPATKEMIAAAALHDETVRHQLTHGLFDGAVKRQRLRVSGIAQRLINHALDVLGHALNPPDGDSRWTLDQQQQLREMTAVVEALEP